MSEQLEMTEIMASQKVIKDPDIIAGLLDYYLHKKISDAISEQKSDCASPPLWEIVADIQTGFEIDQAGWYSDYRYGDILVMMMEENNIKDEMKRKYFQVPKENGLLGSTEYTAAHHCYWLALDFIYSMKRDTRIKQLAMVDYKAFTSYLRSVWDEQYKDSKHLPWSYLGNMDRLDKAYNKATEFYQKYQHQIFNESDPDTDLTLGNLITVALKCADSRWTCGRVPLSLF